MGTLVSMNQRALSVKRRVVKLAPVTFKEFRRPNQNACQTPSVPGITR